MDIEDYWADDAAQAMAPLRDLAEEHMHEETQAIVHLHDGVAEGMHEGDQAICDILEADGTLVPEEEALVQEVEEEAEAEEAEPMQEELALVEGAEEAWLYWDADQTEAPWLSGTEDAEVRSHRVHRSVQSAQ